MLGARLACAAVVIALLGVGPPARAEVELGVFAGGKFYSEDGALGRARVLHDPDSALVHSGLLGMRLGWLQRPGIGFEVEIAASPAPTRGRLREPDGREVEGTQSGAAVLPVRGHIIVAFLAGRVQPLLLLGVGAHMATPLAPGLIQTDAVAAIHGGGGVAIGVQRHWGLRLEGRFLFVEGIRQAYVPEGEVLLGIYARFPAPTGSAP
ncbi:MAG: hypothetical protein NZ890_11310 [Myxococcota bacterium]|nr:hypothetical protein [Myxococcota bacterium]